MPFCSCRPPLSYYLSGVPAQHHYSMALFFNGAIKTHFLNTICFCFTQKDKELCTKRLKAVVEVVRTVSSLGKFFHVSIQCLIQYSALTMAGV